MDLPGCKPRSIFSPTAKPVSGKRASCCARPPLWSRTGFGVVLLAVLLREANGEPLFGKIDAVTETEVRPLAVLSQPPSLAQESDAYVCRGVLGFVSQNFVLQAKAASAVLSRVMVNGKPVIVTWDTTVNMNGRNLDWSSGKSFSEIYLKNRNSVAQSLDPNNTACIVGLETPESLGGDNIIGVASVCGACDTVHHNRIFLVSAFTDDSITFATILHEMLHLFCGVHTDTGVMRSIISRDSDIALIGDATKERVESKIESPTATCIALASDYERYDVPRNDNADNSDNTETYIALGISTASVGIICIALL